MRLYTIYYLCKNSIEVIKEIKGVRTNQGNDEYKIEGWTNIKRVLDTLYSIECLQGDIQEIYSRVPTHFLYQSEILYNGDRYNQFIGRVSILRYSMITIIDLYESFGYEQTENNLEIKIPEGLDLEKLTEFSSDLNLIIQQCPFIKRESGLGKVLQTDIGSVWLVLAGSAAFLASVGYLVSVVVKAKADLLAIRQGETLFNEMEVKAETLVEVKRVFDMQRDIIMERYISELTDKTGIELNDGEEKAKAEKCIEKLDKWMSKGMQIYAAIDTPREIQVLFPEQPELKNLLGDAIKLIEKSTIEPQ